MKHALARGARWGLHCSASLRKRELVGAGPLHLACGKTVPSLKVPAGDFIVPLRSTNANLSGRGPSTLPAARPFGRLKAPLGLSLFRCAPQTRTCRGGAPPSCCRKTVLSLKVPTGAFIVPLRSANANLSGRSPSTLPAARPFRRLKSPLGTSLFRCAPQTRTC